MTLSAHTGLTEYFKDSVHQSMMSLKISASPDAEFYLVHLLTRFASSDLFFERDSSGRIEDKALALRLADAAFASRSEKLPQLKKMGDVALFVSGFFADSFFKKVISADYYIHMGEAAYTFVSQLLNHDEGKVMADLFEELSGNFVHFVDVLSDVSDRTHLASDQNLLKLYERWLKTGSERTRDMLIQSGLIPNEMMKARYEQ